MNKDTKIYFGIGVVFTIGFLIVYNQRKRKLITQELSFYPEETSSNSSVQQYFKNGETVLLKNGWNLRNLFTYQIQKTSNGTEKAVIKKIEINKTISGITGTWIQVELENNGFSLFSNYWINLSGITKIK